MAERGFSLVETLVAVALVALGTLGLAGATLSALAAARAAGASARLAAAASAGIEVARAIEATAVEPAPDDATLAWRADWVERWQSAAAEVPWPLEVSAEWPAEGGATISASTRDGGVALQLAAVPLMPPMDAAP